MCVTDLAAWWSCVWPRGQEGVWARFPERGGWPRVPPAGYLGLGVEWLRRTVRPVLLACGCLRRL